MNATNSMPSAPVDCPRCLAKLLERGADLLQVHWPTVCVLPFTWREGEQHLKYLAKFAWPLDGINGPIVEIYQASGYFLCRSLPGQPWTIDSTCWQLDEPASDELDL